MIQKRNSVISQMDGISLISSLQLIPRIDNILFQIQKSGELLYQIQSNGNLKLFRNIVKIVLINCREVGKGGRKEVWTIFD